MSDSHRSLAEPSIDRRWLRRCHELAAVAKAKGNTAVGSVIAIGSDRLAEAAEQRPGDPDVTSHAELLAVRAACARVAVSGRDLRTATLYTTIEPCVMCGYALRAAGIGRLVFIHRCGSIGGVRGPLPVVTATLKELRPPPVVVEAGADYPT